MTEVEIILLLIGLLGLIVFGFSGGTNINEMYAGAGRVLKMLKAEPPKNLTQGQGMQFIGLMLVLGLSALGLLILLGDLAIAFVTYKTS